MKTTIFHKNIFKEKKICPVWAVSDCQRNVFNGVAGAFDA